ncbi:MAG: molybdopterin-synthase adenylyltransferase MoeB [Thiohalocapsa sp.]|nr:molybdopterin-synthase adenylyltransferase MoeB [Thiohalocapsa sp.]
MNDDQLLRYSRHIMLPGFGAEGQQRLLEARVLVVGLGGLGSPAAMYLAAAGVGRLLLADFDAVDLSNLQRQLLHTGARVGRSKVDSAIEALHALNPDVVLEPIKGSLDAARLTELAERVDLILDCSDNFATRFAVNAACFEAGIPLVSGAAIRGEGQVAVFSGQAGGPCYQCLYPNEGGIAESCSREGVLAPLVGIIGSIQAMEAIKLLTGLGEPMFGRLLLLDALRMQWRDIKLPPDPVCPVCAPSSAPADV